MSDNIKRKGYRIQNPSGRVLFERPDGFFGADGIREGMKKSGKKGQCARGTPEYKKLSAILVREGIKAGRGGNNSFTKQKGSVP